MVGKVSHEAEANVPASEAWKLYGSLELLKLLAKELPFITPEVLEGDGGVGTIIKLTFPPDTPGFTFYKQKFTKIDHERCQKEVEVIEGGMLNLGFTSYMFRFEIIEKGDDSCIIKSTIEYDLKEEDASNAALVRIDPLAHLAKIATNYLLKNKA